MTETTNRTNTPVVETTAEAAPEVPSKETQGFGNNEGRDFERNLSNKREKLVLVEHKFELWTGQARLEETDFNIQEGKTLLKEEDIKATSGQKWLIDRATLKPFMASKKRFLTVLENCGTRFMGGYVVPADRWGEIKSLLDKEVEVFNNLKATFLFNYQNNVQSWALQHPRMSQSILNAVPEKSEIEEKIRSGYMGVRLNPVTPDDAEALENELSGLTGQLVSETVRAAAEFQRYSLKEGNRLKSLKQLTIICQKLRGLSFMAAGCLPFSQLLETELVAMRGKNGKGVDNSPENLARILALTGILTNKELLLEILEGRMSMTEVANRLSGTAATHASEAKAAPKAAETTTPAVVETVPAPEDFSLDGGTVEAPVTEPAATTAPSSEWDDASIEAYFNARPSETDHEAAPAVTEVSVIQKEEPKAPLYVPSEKPAQAMPGWF